MGVKQELRTELHVKTAELARERRRHGEAMSALAGQRNAARIMMAALDRQRKLLAAYGIEADYDFDTPVDEQYSWPAP